jgi:hypothetical protein
MNESMKESMLSIIASFWENFTSEESWIPFLLSMSLWFSCWVYSKQQGKDYYARWQNIHALHHFGAIFFGSLSMYFDDDSIFNERIGILWSIPYFIIDILDCVVLLHFTYLIHGVICLGLGLGNYNMPLLRELRMNSKASFIESSTFVLHHAKRTRSPVIFFIFALVFTACRIVWIPLMMKELYEHQVQPYDWVFLALAAFYILQVYWWIKIIKILIHGRAPVDDQQTTKQE